MKITVINGSPKGERSDTLKITKAFLKGMKEEADVIDTMKEKVNPCLGCYSCWTRTPGVCVQKDGMEKILEKIKNSDLVIWSAPLYCYGLPSNCKAVIDRMIPLSMPNQIVDSNNQTRHPKRNEKNARHILISSCGFPDREGNFDGLVFQFTRMFGKASPIILCSEAPMLSVAIASFVTVPYLLLVKKAGSEFAKSGNISEQTMSKLNKLMLPADEYRKHADKTFGVK